MNTANIHPVSYFGLKIPTAQLTSEEKSVVLAFIESVLPTRSVVPNAEQLWRFVLHPNGEVQEIPKQSEMSRKDLPNNFLFGEVYDRICRGLVELGIYPPPPPLMSVDHEACRRAFRREKELHAFRKSVRGRLHQVGVALGLCVELQPIAYPPTVSREQQIALLVQWISDRISDGSLVSAILKSLASKRWFMSMQSQGYGTRPVAGSSTEDAENMPATELRFVDQIQALSAEEQVVMSLMYLDKLSPVLTAASLEWSIDRVEMTHVRALKKLSKLQNRLDAET